MIEKKRHLIRLIDDGKLRLTITYCGREKFSNRVTEHLKSTTCKSCLSSYRKALLFEGKSKRR